MKRVILLLLDGLRRDLVTEADMPNLSAFARGASRFGAHRTVFPSLTRCVSASFSTGCHPARHGLQGNTVALMENGRLALADAGAPDFLDRKHAATGTKLAVPTMADRLVDAGGFTMFSNASPGAARAHDPNGVATVFNRAVGWGGARALGTSADSPGDDALIDQFIETAVAGRSALAIAWCAEPDHVQHSVPLGSPAHRAVLRQADARVARLRDAVARRRDAGEDILFAVASDHGHETVAGIADPNAALVDAGLKQDVDDMDLIAVANGTATLLYVHPDRAGDAGAALEVLRRQDWAGEVFDADALAGVGQVAAHHLVGAVAMRHEDKPNAFGVPGLSFNARPHFGKDDHFGNGMHGGLGRYEQMPLLLVEGTGFTAQEVSAPTSIVDIAPTILRHLDLPDTGMDGRALQAVPVPAAA